MVDIVFPQKKLRAVRVMFHPQLTSRSGGATISGIEQIVASSAGRWAASLAFEVGHGMARMPRSARDADSVLVWRALLAQLEGRTNNLIIGPYDSLNTPGAIAGTRYAASVPHSDDAAFEDESQYAQPGSPAVVAAAYVVGATAITVRMLAGHMPEAGQYFSVVDRLYLIKTVAAGAGAGEWICTVWPPARDAVTAAQVAAHLPADFDEPRCKMRLAQDGAGQLALAARYRASPSIDLNEAN